MALGISVSKSSIARKRKATTGQLSVDDTNISADTNAHKADATIKPI